MLIKHPTGLRWDQLYTKLFRNIYEGSIKWKEDRYQGRDYWQVENWNRTSEWFARCKAFPSHLSWGSCSTCRSWMTWINQLGNGLRNKKARGFRLGTRNKEFSGRNSHHMCGMILWKARPAKHDSLNREELHHGEAHMRAERRRA